MIIGRGRRKRFTSNVPFVVLFIIMIIVLLVSSLAVSRLRHPLETLPSPRSFDGQAELEVWNFTSHHMVNKAGAIEQTASYYRNKSKNITSLSESIGLLLDYSILSHDHKLFVQQEQVVKQSFMLDQGISWRVMDGERSPVNSTIDDLRIIAALTRGSGQFHDPSALHFAKILATGLLTHDATSTGWLLDYSSLTSIAHQQSPWLAVWYWNLANVRTLSKLNKKYLPILLHEREALAHATNHVGLYALFYNPDTHTYRFPSSNRLNMDDELLTALHAQSCGLPTKKFRNHLAILLDKSTLIPAEVSEDWTIKSSVQSPAIYALAIRLFYRAGDDDDAIRCLHLLLDMQVQKKGDLGGYDYSIYGAFAMKPYSPIFSFDQLESLLSLRQVMRSFL
ncbi:hypothetical protein [Sulfoacidibacillus ferrooxidans]|uniref:Glycosyl hydrolase family 8 n=1 Tax=Sulfoacidibacillus ferrooxidans TaxID=2005001 RepID=A0A9X2AGA5_9BACL|nr:hypothetical protein [Sulfoacidibacillus ferrooxidans]MCI0184856.1 hypothetical protein [Sulfoacidibacillus ferrooxidans]